jgi:hypothetical protein
VITGNPNQLREDDTVFGDQPPESGAVLGGMESVKKRLERIEGQLQEAQQERVDIQSQLEQLNQGQLQLQDKLSQVLTLVEPFEQLQLFDPSEFQLKLQEIQAQLQQAEQERSHLQFRIAEIPSQLSQDLTTAVWQLQSQLSDFKAHLQLNLQSQLSEIEARLVTSNREKIRDLATQLYQLLSSQLLSEIQTQLQQTYQEQKHLQSLLSELPLQISQLVNAELEKVQPQTTTPSRTVPPPVPDLAPLNDPWSSTPPSTQNELISAVGVDYTRLRDLLAAGEWKEADRETSAVMLKVCGREKENWFDAEHIEIFPCEDLRTIDQLWVNFSEGRFGFSVQKRIWESVGGKSGVLDSDTYHRFGERVEWRENQRWKNYNDFTFTSQAPHGHLPRRPSGSCGSGVSMGWWFSLFSRQDL